MISFFYKDQRKELLEQSINNNYQCQSYDSDYTKAEYGGFDEMFPSIDECFYPYYPWKGIRIPDHGEVWALPWEYSIDNQKLIMEVYGVRFPYKLEKIVSFINDNILRIDYELRNLSNFEFNYLWAAHPIFYLEESSEIILPEGVKEIITVFSLNGRLGKYGSINKWPNLKPDNLNLNFAISKDAKDIEKYYLKGKMPKGWCTISYPSLNTLLALSFPIQEVPYLAVLLNEGGELDLLNIFFEPCTSPFDRIDMAILRKECSSISPNSITKWFLNFTVTQIKDFKDITAKGDLID